MASFITQQCILNYSMKNIPPESPSDSVEIQRAVEPNYSVCSKEKKKERRIWHILCSKSIEVKRFCWSDYSIHVQQHYVICHR